MTERLPRFNHPPMENGIVAVAGGLAHHRRSPWGAELLGPADRPGPARAERR